MALRTGHGGSKGWVAVETLPVDELPRGVPADPPPEGTQKRVTSRKAFGRVPAGTDEARELARRASKARWEKARQLKFLKELGLLGATPAELAPFLDAGGEFVAAEARRLAQEVGGGVCPPNACVLLQQAALAMAGSRKAYADGDLVLGAKLGVEVRQNLLAAYELTAKEARGRKQQSNPSAELANLLEAPGESKNQP